MAPDGSIASLEVSRILFSEVVVSVDAFKLDCSLQVEVEVVDGLVTVADDATSWFEIIEDVTLRGEEISVGIVKELVPDWFGKTLVEVGVNVEVSILILVDSTVDTVVDIIGCIPTKEDEMSTSTQPSSVKMQTSSLSQQQS